ATKPEQGLNDHRQRDDAPWSTLGLLGSELECHDHGLPSQWFSRASVIHWSPPLLPGLSAYPPAVSSKIIPRISREAGPPATVRSQRTFVLAHQTGLPSAGHHHALVLDSYDRFVRLFTPVSAEEAGRLERGVPLDGPLYWTDRPVPEET